MGDKLYGAKCHVCGHLRHDGLCSDCIFCFEEWFHKAIQTHGLDLFSPEVREAVLALRNGRSHPLVDQLRDEIQAGGQTVEGD